MRGVVRKVEGKKGVTYEVRVDYPRGRDGTRKRVCQRFKKKRDAEQALAKMLYESQNGYVAPEKISVAEYLNHYLEIVKDTLEWETCIFRRKVPTDSAAKSPPIPE